MFARPHFLVRRSSASRALHASQVCVVGLTAAILGACSGPLGSAAPVEGEASEAPLTHAEVEHKFMQNALPVLSPSRAEALRDALLGIDRVADVSGIVLH